MRKSQPNIPQPPRCGQHWRRPTKKKRQQHDTSYLLFFVFFLCVCVCVASAYIFIIIRIMRTSTHAVGAVCPIRLWQLWIALCSRKSLFTTRNYRAAELSRYVETSWLWWLWWPYWALARGTRAELVRIRIIRKSINRQLVWQAHIRFFALRLCVCEGLSRAVRSRPPDAISTGANELAFAFHATSIVYFRVSRLTGILTVEHIIRSGCTKNSIRRRA